MSKDNFLKIGKITKHHGIKGYAKLYYFGDLNNFAYKEVFLYNKGKLLSYFIENWRIQKNFIILKLEGINSINDVEQYLKGKDVFINKKQLPELDNDEYYWFQLIGLNVFDTDKNFLGILDEIIETGSNDVFVIKNKEKDKEILIPYIDDVVKSIDIDKREMVVSLLEEV